jgi:DNA-binding phage protein
MSAEQRAKLSAAQNAYIANDPRWAEHRRKLAAAQEAKRMTLMENEVAAIIEMRSKGMAFKEVSEKIGVCREVIGRELTTLGIAVDRGERRTTLMENELTAIMAMRNKGRTFSYIAQDIGVSESVIRRELTARGIPTVRIKSDRRARPGRGFWRSFD